MWTVIAAADAALMGWLRALHAPWLDQLMTWLSAGAGAGLVWLALAGFALTRKQDQAAAWRVMLAVMLSFALVDGALKPIIGRQRPALADARDTQVQLRDLPPMPSTAAFPSGHATASFASAVTVSRMWPHTTPLWWALAILVGFARIYVGHHYPLDIVGGAIAGIAIGWWVIGGRRPATHMGRLPNPRPSAASVRD